MNDQAHRTSRSSAEVVLSSLLFEEVKLLEGLQSVDSQDKVLILVQAKLSHVILELDIIKDERGNVVSILFGKSIIWGLVNSIDQFLGIFLNGIADLGGESLSSVVSRVLREGNSERQIVIDRLKIGSNGLEKSSLWVLLDLGGICSCFLVSSNILLSDGISSNVWKGLKEGNSWDSVSVEASGLG